jgi:hypothetical protein
MQQNETACLGKNNHGSTPPPVENHIKNLANEMHNSCVHLPLYQEESYNYSFIASPEEYNLSSLRYTTKDGQFIDLEDTIAFNKRLFPNKKSMSGQAVIRLTNELFAHYPLTGKKHQLKTTAFKNIVSNLIMAYLESKCIAFSFRRQSFISVNKAYAKHYSYDLIIPIINWFKDNGYIEIKKGFYFANKSRMSRLIPTNKLVLMYNREHNVLYSEAPQDDTTTIAVNGKEFHVRNETFMHSPEFDPVCIHLKKDKKLKDKRGLYIKLASFRQEVQRYNEFMATITVILPENDELLVRYEGGSDNDTADETGYAGVTYYGSWNYPRSSERSQTMTNASFMYGQPHATADGKVIYYKEASDTADATHIYTLQTPLTASLSLPITGTLCDNSIIYKKLHVEVHRVFNNEDLSTGGRFYGHEFQSLNKNLRRKILINGEAVTELDYKALHISLLYNLCNIKTPSGDLYDLFDKNQLLRRAVKKMFNIVINAKSRISALCAFRNKVLLSTKSEIALEMQKYCITPEMLLNRIIEKHAVLSKFLHSGKGIELQYLDSCIATDILNYFTDKEIPCLPVHDSFIVQCKHGEELKNVMHEMYLRHTGFECGIDVKY